jgi:hypothetical protein
MALDTQLDAHPPTDRRGSPEQMTLPEMDVQADPETSQPAAGQSGAAPIWLQRLSLLVLVLFCVYLGVLVMVLPWWTRVWDENLWIQSHPALASVLHTGAVRGVISGLGLLDIWIGVSEAVHYRDHRG